MPRPEVILESDGPRARLARELRRLRAEAGEPSYRELGRRLRWGPATLAKAASDRHPCPTWDVVEALGSELNGDLTRLAQLWREARCAEGLSTEGGPAALRKPPVSTGELQERPARHSSVRFNTPVAQPHAPQGQVARRLRELVTRSDITSSAELKRRTNYAGSTLSEAMNGRKRQNRMVVTRLVQACVPDPAAAAVEIEYLVTVLDTLERRAPEVVERRPDLARLGSGRTSGAAETPVEDLELDVVDSSPALDERPDAGRPDAARASVDGLPRRRTLHRHWLLMAMVLVATLVASGISVVAMVDTTCGSGVARIDEQCIGVSDGTINVASDPGLATVFSKIKAENDRVMLDAARVPVVSVAYVAPFPATHSALSEQVQRELEGVYQVQLQRNEAGGPNVLGGPPRLQLLIANLGDGAGQWADVSRQLSARAAPVDPSTGKTNPAPVVAVTGLDQSSPPIAAAVAALGRAHIPVVATGAVGDISDDPARDGFFAVAPSMVAQIDTADRYARYLAGGRGPLLVADVGDPSGLVAEQELQRQHAALTIAQPSHQPPPEPTPFAMRFDSRLPALQTAFVAMLPTICAQRPVTVFFAGQNTSLPEFIRALGTRPCSDAPVTVITLSGGGRTLSSALQAEADNRDREHQLHESITRGVRVVVTARAHPNTWRADPVLIPPASHAVLDGDFATAYPQQFPGQPLDDEGDVILGHDAMQTIVEAIARSRPPQSSDPVTAALVREALEVITVNDPVYSASGPVAYAGAGYPIDKSIPLTQVTPDGRITLLAITPDGP